MRVFFHCIILLGVITSGLISCTKNSLLREKSFKKNALVITKGNNEDCGEIEEAYSGFEKELVKLKNGLILEKHGHINEMPGPVIGRTAGNLNS